MSIKNLNTNKSPEPEQIYAQVNMAAKRNSVVKEAKNDAEKTLKELEREIISSNNNNDQGDTQEFESDGIDNQNDSLVDDKLGSKRSSISLEDTKITITPQLENDNETNENLETTQSMEKSGKTVALQFDEVLSDVDVEYL